MRLKTFKQCSLLLILLAFAGSIYAQKRTVTGKVTDSSDGTALPGVSVMVDGTGNGTSTNEMGEYSLDVSDGDELIFSFIGYKDEKVKVSGAIRMDVALHMDAEELGEVVVVGYGTMKKSDKTGAVMSVSPEEMNRGVVQDPIQAIAGKIAGVNITKKGGDPNAGFSVQIRGTAGLSSGTSPLYVVDGVPGIDPTTVAPEDIASFNVLKDASSAAIYGSRGASGVIIITTKQGKKNGKTQVSYDGYVSADYVANRLDLMSADDVRNYAKKHNMTFDDRGANTNWQDEIYRTGMSQSQNLAISGSGKNHTYRASVNYQNYDGVLKGTDKERMIMRLNATQNALDNKLKLTYILSGTFERNNYINTGGNGAESVMFQAFSRNPTYPVRNDDGSFFEVSDFENSNPVALIDQITNNRDAKRYLANIKADFEAFKGFFLGVNVSYRRDDSESSFFRPSYQKTTSDGGFASRSYGNFETKLFEATAKYNKEYLKHSLNLLAGYSWQEDMGDGFSANGRQMLSDFVKADNLGFANDVLPQDISSWRNRSRLISFIGRMVYNYDSRYFLTATIRRDGSSRFGNNQEWGWFPSFSGAWDIAKESFMSSQEIFSALKLRAGFGITGNQEIGNYNDIAKIGTGGRTLDPTTGKKTLIISQNSNANPDLKWEENREWNIGLDFSILNNRITGSVDYYDKTTDDLLAQYSVPVPPNRHGSIFANAGEISNKGLEVNLNANVVKTNDFSWKTSVSYAHNKQEVVSLSDSNYSLDNMHVSYISGRGMVGVWTQIVEPGKELGTFYGWKHAGIDQNGEWLFYDKNGKITKEQKDEDRQAIGSALPDFTLGWTNSLKYKNFDLNFTFRGVIGNDVLNVTRMVLGNPNMLPGRNALTSAADMAEVLKDSPKYSDYYIEDGSFIRLDNVALGYNFDVSEVKHLSKLRVYMSSNNLFTLTKYSGIDPENSYGGYEGLGLDMYDIYPKTRTVTFGMQVTF